MMKKIFLLWLVLVFAVSFSSAQEVSDAREKESDIPENVRISLDALLKTRTSNQVFDMTFLNNFYFALQSAPKKVYTNILFNALLDQDAVELKKKYEEKFNEKMEEYNKFVEEKKKAIEEENKEIEIFNRGKQKSKQKPLKTWEKPPAPQKQEPSHFHNLYLRVVQDGNIIQRFKSPIPYDGQPTDYYSFGLILEPGKYDVLINVDRVDNSADGTLLIELEVPRLTLMDLVSPLPNLEYSQPVFYRKVMTATRIEKRFTVLKNKYQVGKQIFYPVVGEENEFKTNAAPILTLFIKGGAKIENNQPQWDIATEMEVRQGKKKILIFKIPNITAPYFFQKIAFKQGDQYLPAGEYTLLLVLNDKNHSKHKAKIEIPFKLIE